MELERITSIAKAAKQFLEMANEPCSRYEDGYIDHTLLCIHCDEFNNFSEAETAAIVEGLGFAVLKETLENDEIQSYTYSYNLDYDHDKLKELVDKFLEEEV